MLRLLRLAALHVLISLHGGLVPALLLYLPLLIQVIGLLIVNGSTHVLGVTLRLPREPYILGIVGGAIDYRVKVTILVSNRGSRSPKWLRLPPSFPLPGYGLLPYGAGVLVPHSLVFSTAFTRARGQRAVSTATISVEMSIRLVTLGLLGARCTYP